MARRVFVFVLSPGGDLAVHTDSSFNTNYDSRNLNGAVVLFGESVVHWSSSKMRFVVLSTDEAEIVGCVNALRQLLFFKFVSCEILHLTRATPLAITLDDEDAGEAACANCPTPKLLIDNQGSLVFCDKGFGRRTGYLSTKNLYLVQQSRIGAYQPVFVGSRANTADLFTKNLTLEIFSSHLCSFFRFD